MLLAESQREDQPSRGEDMLLSCGLGCVCPGTGGAYHTYGGAYQREGRVGWGGKGAQRTVLGDSISDTRLFYCVQEAALGDYFLLVSRDDWLHSFVRSKCRLGQSEKVEEEEKVLAELREERRHCVEVEIVETGL
jgi:hypothetical protein